MYLTANNLILRTSNAPIYTKISGSVGGVRNGTIENDVFHSIRNDVLVGGLGDDSYNLWDAGSTTVERAGEGVDTVYVQYWGGHALANNIENLVLVSKGATWGTGNALNNVIVAGNSSATLNGGAGDDVLVGGSGADVFVVQAGNGSDAIDNFRSGWDTIKLDGYGLTSWSQVRAAAAQAGNDVAIKLSASEKLVLHNVQLASLHASDFNLSVPAMEAAGFQTLSAAGSAWNAAGWYVVNNAWGSGALVNGRDYTLTASYSAADMTKGTTFSWHYDVNTDLAPNVLAFPEVIFGASPLGGTGIDPTDTAHVFPVKVSDIVALTADYDVSFGGNGAGFNVAYDIFLSKSATGVGQAAVSNEVMVWVHKGSFEAFGEAVGTYTNGAFTAMIYHIGTYTAIVADHDVTVGKIDIGDILTKLKAMGYVADGEYLRSVELGSEVVGGTGSLTINDLDLRVETRNATGGTTVKTVGGSGTSVVDLSAVQNALAKDYVAGTQKTIDGFGYATGIKTTTVDAQGNVIVSKLDVGGRLLGRDVVTHDAKSITIQHFTGTNTLAGTDVASFESNGARIVEHFDASWKLIGADRLSTSTVGAAVTEHFDAAWKLVSADQTIVKSANVIEYQHYDANWKIVTSDIVTTTGSNVTTKQSMGANWAYLGTEQVTHNGDGSTTIQHFGTSGALTGAELVKLSSGIMTTYRYDGTWSLKGSDLTTIDATGVARTASFDAGYRLTETAFGGTDRADTLAGGSGITHFHGGLGSDVMTGGSGVDFFHLDTAFGQGDVDTIRSFGVAKDKVMLDHNVFGALGKVGALDPSMFVVGAKALDANDHLLYDKVKGDLYYDDDGNGAHMPTLLAHIGADGVPGASNFMVG